ncbi:Uracil-DNA glycosylase [Corynebacterium deserti GIMN1.010]|uniref:Uracil-DNA glycosylase n=2 Tax=Corynebacterium TaxID=1716 RepID=A0A0M3Q9J6_9CORY|nr:Uracil-DNA glycosylase [Corynebacterium deserti GIMN1.010]
MWESVDKLPIHDSWKPVLRPLAADIAALGAWLEGEPDGFLPPEPDVFHAFAYPFDQVKVLIMGQDPYPTPGHAMGLSFSTHPAVRPLPRSLTNIFKELSSDLGIEGIPDTGDLRPWCEQGVALFNRVLTVHPGAAGSHKGKGWEKITQHAITALAQRNQPLVAILWGKQAQDVQKFLGETPAICTAHPSPLSASRGFFGSRPFSTANEMLKNLGATPINWQL